MYAFGQKFTFICAILSCLISLTVIVSFVLIEQFRNEMKRVKVLLLVVAICSLGEASAALYVRSNKSWLACQIQAVVISSCLLAALLYEAILSVEMVLMTIKFRQGQDICDKRDGNRHFAYHVFVLLVVISSALAALLVPGGIEQDSEAFHCHYMLGQLHNLIVSAPVVVILLANVVCLKNIFNMLSQFAPSLSEQVDSDHVDALTSSVSASTSLEKRWLSLRICTCVCGCCFGTHLTNFTRLNLFTQRTVRRILLTQLNYLIVFASVIVIFELGEKNAAIFTALSLLLVFVPLNSLLWVYTDPQAMEAWRCLLTGKPIANSRASSSSSGRDSSFDITSSEYGDGRGAAYRDSKLELSYV